MFTMLIHVFCISDILNHGGRGWSINHSGFFFVEIKNSDIDPENLKIKLYYLEIISTKTFAKTFEDSK